MVQIVISQLITMVLIMMIGGILFKYNYISATNAKGLSIVLTRVAVPCNMIVLMQREYSFEILISFLQTCGATVCMLFLGSIVMFIVAKLNKLDLQDCGLFAGGGVYSNVIFMGQPLIMALYGEEGLFFCVAIMLTCNIYLFTACSVLFGLGGSNKKPWKSMIKDAFSNLIFFSAVIGIACFVYSIKIPMPIFDALQYASNTTVCLSMIYIGTLLAGADIKQVFKNKIIYIFSFFTLIVMPVVTKIVVGQVVEGMALDVLVVLMAMPAAAALPSFAELYGNNENKASEYVFISTILSVFTLPLVVQFLV